jgi:hypothetical protein
MSVVQKLTFRYKSRLLRRLERKFTAIAKVDHEGLRRRKNESTMPIEILIGALAATAVKLVAEGAAKKTGEETASAGFKLLGWNPLFPPKSS